MILISKVLFCYEGFSFHYKKIRCLHLGDICWGDKWLPCPILRTKWVVALIPWLGCELARLRIAQWKPVLQIPNTRSEAHALQLYLLLQLLQTHFPPWRFNYLNGQRHVILEASTKIVLTSPRLWASLEEIQAPVEIQPCQGPSQFKCMLGAQHWFTRTGILRIPPLSSVSSWLLASVL